MAWVLLIVAGLLEVVWAIGLKYTEGFARLWPGIVIVAAMSASFWLLATAMKTLPVGTAYGVWVGVGTASRCFPKPFNAARVISIVLIIAGIVGLKLATPG